MGPTRVYGARAEKPLQNADFAMKQTNICRLSGDITRPIYPRLSRLFVHTPMVAIDVFFFNGGRPPSGILAEVKFNVTGIHGRPVSTLTPNLVNLRQRAAEL